MKSYIEIKHSDLNNSVNIEDNMTLKDVSKVKKILSKECNNDKDFLKKVFKSYDKSIEYFNEDSFNNLTKFIDCREIEKIILALKYKTGLNYREKCKIIKELTKDFTTEFFFSLENIVLSYWNANFVQGLVTPEYSAKLEENFIEQFSILMNTITLIKCVKYDYYKANVIEFFKDGSFKKTIVKNKMLGCAGPIFMVIDINKIDDEDIFDCVQQLECSVSTREEKLFYTTYFACLIAMDTVTEDLYSKIVLKEDYRDTVNNRICNTKEISMLKFNMHDFLRRKILLPKDGVILLIKDNPIIESILLKERICNDINNLIIVTRYKNGREIITTLMIKESEYLGDVRPLNIYSVEEHLDISTTLDYVTSFFEIYDKDYYKYDVNYEVIAPYYWKYRDKEYKSSNDVVDHRGVIIKREYSVEIAPFVRKINGTPGKDAIELSKKLGIILEDGYTIVRPHIRTYNKV